MKDQLKFEKGIDELIGMVQYAKKQHEETIRLNELLQDMIFNAGGYLWRKDIDGRYEYCDPSWCKVFFKLPHGCDIIGSTDKELLSDFASTGKIHTYGDVCVGTDQHCIQEGKKSHYIEMGWIEDELFVIDVIKTPIFENNIITGTVGFARDISADPTWVCDEVYNALKSNEASIVYKDGDNVAAYHIYRKGKNKQHKCLKHFPNT